MDIERALVTKIISTGQLEDAISKGVRADLFADEEVQDLFGYILDHNRRYGSPPSMKMASSENEDFEFELVQDPLAKLIDSFNVLAKRRLAQEMLFELAEATKDPKKSESIDLQFLEASRKLATLVPQTEVHNFKGDMEKRIQEQEELQKSGKLPGIPFGYPTLDAKTGGILSHEFVVVAGFSGFGKSTFMKSVAFNVFAMGYTPLIITLEEEKKLVAQQFDAMAASMDLMKMRQLDLEEEDFERWREYKERLKHNAAEIPIIDNLRHATPDAIFAETVRHKPDLVIVDYISLMRTGRPGKGVSMWQQITEITQDLKQNARTLQIPILAAAQTNRAGGKDGAELDNIGNSISIIQDADKVIGLFADEDMKEAKQMEVRLNKNRRGGLVRFKCRWDHETQEFRELQGQDMFKKMRRERNGQEDE